MAAGFFAAFSTAASAFFAVFLAGAFFATGLSASAASAFFVVFFAGAFFAGAFFAADFFSSAGALAAVAVAFLARVVFFAGVVTSVVSSVVAESFAEARDALTRVPFIDGHAQQSRLQIGIPLPV